MSIIAPLKKLSAISWPDSSTFNSQPRAPEPIHKWTLGSPGKGFILQDGTVHTWPTQHMRPTHIEEETRRNMASNYKIAPVKRGSEFHIEPTGRVWQFGNGRQLDAQDQQTIQRTPTIWMGDPADNSPVQQDGYGHAIGLAPRGKEVGVQNEGPTDSGTNPQQGNDPVVAGVVDMWNRSLLDAESRIHPVSKNVHNQHEKEDGSHSGISHGRIIAWNLNTCSRCGGHMEAPNEKYSSRCSSCNFSRQLSKEAAGAFIPALQMKPPTHECPGCQLPLRSNGWTGYTPQGPDSYGQRSWRCPECSTDWRGGNPPVPYGQAGEQTLNAIMLGSSVQPRRLNSRVATNVYEHTYEGAYPMGFGLENRRPMIWDREADALHIGQYDTEHSDLLAKTGEPQNGAAMGWLGPNPDAMPHDAVYNRRKPNEIGWYGDSAFDKPSYDAHKAAEQFMSQNPRIARLISVADNTTLDSRNFADPTEPRASDAPQPKGCTCPEGYKLDCPIHGLNGDDSHDLGWSLPEGSPVGYPQAQPRTYQQTMSTVRQISSCVIYGEWKE